MTELTEILTKIIDKLRHRILCLVATLRSCLDSGFFNL
jgi:hypothetical protein